ncbi:DUF3426 domain-containing protein [Aquitalea sp. LB_tupeE]|uniref:DUF3426 domain-containing protein n=1 Tax=Aquitalea sp. LB_tupeE TaxID=2748078 RepID=UPI0015BFA8DE|nr:DUF3426 domain-containing protein [Aquitalea sp. LB_tupeE]NWK77080.1 zinc-ribbon domain-containing protein [Aquitalea sp. LB_tupeE]
MSYTTQCPSCQTRFKVNDTQLAAAKGLVRCGRCAHVFNATEHFVSTEPATPPVLTQPEAPAPAPSPSPVAPSPLAPSPVTPPVHDPMDDFELELPDFDPQTATETPVRDDFNLDIAPEDKMTAVDTEQQRSEAEEFQRALAEALNTRRAPTASAAYAATPLDAEEDKGLPDVFGKSRRGSDENPPPAAPPDSTAAEVPASTTSMELPHEDARPDSEHADAAAAGKARNPLLTVLMVLLATIATLLLAGQLVYFNRTRIAAEVPEARPALEAFCSLAGCKVPWPSDIAQIRTEWSELAFVPEHPNLVQLSATLKNHAAFAQNYPMLEVSLKDADDQVLIRKVFAPKEYLKADDLKLQRFNANSEVKITMRLDIGKVRAMGYSLYWFYP